VIIQGSYWDYLGLIAPAPGTAYLGTQGNIGHVNAGGAGSAVVEDSGGEGTERAHWEETVYKNELMTGYLSGSLQPLSEMTIRSLVDLNNDYVVDITKADPYVIPTSSPTVAGRRQLENDAINMGKDVYTGPVFGIETALPKPGKEAEFAAVTASNAARLKSRRLT